MPAQHYVTGNRDDSFTLLADKYGVNWTEIANLTFGSTRASIIYPWLRDNGGKRQVADSSKPTGYNWCFSKGMVINIPVEESLSPVLHSYSDAKPGGPLVTIIYADTAQVGASGNPQTRQEFAPATGKDSSPVPSPTATKAAVGSDSMIWIAAAALGLFLLMGKGGKKGKSRKTTTRRRR